LPPPSYCALLLLVLLAVIVVLNSNLLRPTLEHVITSKTHRETKINGDLRAHLLSWAPSVEIGGITIKNPPWADRPIMFSADQLRVSVSLELPSNDETEDNIVVMWVPKQPVKAGSSLRYRYRLQWCATEPHQTALGRCVATRLGRGGEPGKVRPEDVHKFMVEFLGGPLAILPFGVRPKPVLWSSSGTFSYVFTEAVPDGVAGHWRAQFDFTGAAGPNVVDMRLYLKNGEQILSETWLYQFHIV
jgi:glucan biosynthesis protein MdoG/AsmA-like protein